MRYSQEFKDNVVARLLSKELSISEAVGQYSIGKSTISYWLRIAREQAVCGTLPNKGNLKPMTSLKLPKGVTYLQAHTAVVAREVMSETVFGQFCRKHGYLAFTVSTRLKSALSAFLISDNRACTGTAVLFCSDISGGFLVCLGMVYRPLPVIS